MRKEDEVQIQLLKHFEIHKNFTKIFLDAFVLLDKNRSIVKFNAAFNQLCEMRAIDVSKLGRIDDVLEIVIPGENTDAISVLLSGKNPTRIDEVHAQNKRTGKEADLIMSSYPYINSADQILGACIVMRDVTAETNLQTKYQRKSMESDTDALTGLYLRRYFEKEITAEIKKFKDSQKNPAIGVLMFDLDKFKNVNDTYGHQAGDFVLRETAQLLQKNSRKKDILGRYGGEELIVIILNTDPQSVTLAAEKFRRAIENHNYKFQGKQIPVTVSIGVTLISDAQVSQEKAIEKADSCLYQAKKKGRNLVVVDFGSGCKTAPEFLKATNKV